MNGRVMRMAAVLLSAGLAVSGTALRAEDPAPWRPGRGMVAARADYRVSITGETFGQGPWRTMTGRKLVKPEVIIREKPGSALLRYRKLE